MKLHSSKWYLVLFLLGFLSMGYELLLSSAIGLITSQPVLGFGVVLCAYMLGLAFGSLLVDRLPKSDDLGRLIRVELGLVCVAVVLSVALGFVELILANHYGTDLAESMRFPFAAKVYLGFGFLCSLVVGTLTGFELPLVFKSLEQSALSYSGRLMGFNYFGNLFGGVFVPIFFVPGFGVEKSFLVLGFLNLFLCFSLVLFERRMNVKEGVAVFFVSLFLFGGVVSLPGFKDVYLKARYSSSQFNVFRFSDWENFFKALQFQPKTHRVNTPYQRIDHVFQRIYDRRFGNEPKQYYALFLEGHLQFAEVEHEEYHRSMVELAANNHTGSDVRRVLILGGGDGILARTVLDQWPTVEHIQMIELDEGMLSEAKRRPVLKKLHRNVFDEERLRVQVSDAFVYVNRPIEGRPYDVVFVDFPFPNSFDLMRLYSLEFYQGLGQFLSQTGVLVLDYPLETNLKTDEQFKSEYRNKVIAATLKAAGFQYLLGFGANNPFVWASKKQAPNLDMTNSQFSGPASENFKLWPTLNDIEPDPSLVNSIYRPRGLRN